MPADFAQKLARGVTEEDARKAQALKDCASLSVSWKDSPEAPPNVPPLEVIVRPSDEDMNSHVNQAMYSSYYEDAIRAMPGLRDVKIRHMFVDYVKETRRGWRLHVVVRKLQNNEAILEIIDVAKPEVVLSRCVASWLPSPESNSAL